MNVLIIRHAVAEDREDFKKSGMTDDLRPLTVEGRKKMRRAAEGLRRVIETIDLVAASPFVRAIETAHVVAKAFDKVPIVELKALEPGGKPEQIFKFLAQQAKQTIVLVGHEPDLGRFVCLSIGCKIADRVPLKKGGACLISFGGPVASGAGALCLLLSPGVMRKLARKV